jgi:hypothetical protein
LIGGYDYSNYYATVPGGGADSPYDYFFIRSGIDWHVSEQLTVGCFYQYQESQSSQPNGFKNNLSGVNLTYHF